MSKSVHEELPFRPQEEFFQEDPTYRHHFFRRRAIQLAFLILASLGLVIALLATFRRSTQVDFVPDEALPPASKTEADLLTDWKEYFNDDWGYRLKYPPAQTRPIVLTGPPFLVGFEFVYQDQRAANFIIYHFLKPEEQGLEEYLRQEILGVGPEAVLANLAEPIQLAGQPAWRLELLPAAVKTDRPVANCQTYLTGKDDKILLISFYLFVGEKEFQVGYLDVLESMLDSLAFLRVQESAGSSESETTYRIETGELASQLVAVASNGGEAVIREYDPSEIEVCQLSVSPGGGYLLVELAANALGQLELIDLAVREPVVVLPQYGGRWFWFAEGQLVYNAPEKVVPSRPFGTGEGLSLAVFEAKGTVQRLLKQADETTDYILERIENNEIIYKKVRVEKRRPDWLAPTISYWRTNFSGTLEERIEASN